MPRSHTSHNFPLSSRRRHTDGAPSSILYLNHNYEGKPCPMLAITRPSATSATGACAANFGTLEDYLITK